MKYITATFILVLLSQITFSQTRKVSGIVKDENGLLMPLVVIEVKETKNKTHTDINGKFEINVEKKDIIIISYIGYEPKEIRIEDKIYFEINLEVATRKISRGEKRFIKRELIKKGSYVFPD